MKNEQKIVSMQKYSTKMHIPAKMHKPLRAGKVERDPTKKARASVMVVIVIDGPA